MAQPTLVPSQTDSSASDKQLIISWPGHQLTVPLVKPEIRLGRAYKQNDIIIDYPVVSRYHATLTWQGDHYEILDGQTHQEKHRPSTNGLHREGHRLTRSRLHNGDVIRIPDRQGNFIVLMYFDASAPPPSRTKQIKLDKIITLGRDERNDLTLDDPLASAFHAVVSPKGPGHAVRDLKSNSGTYVNGQRIAQVDLHLGDVIQIGSSHLRYEDGQLIRLSLSQQGVKLTAIDLQQRVPVAATGTWFPRLWSTNGRPATDEAGYRLILHPISLSIEPREFVAIVGGSGTGKSTLLNALNGSRPAEGQVLINNDNLYHHFDAYRHGIGYVPQDDIIHRDLKVEEALSYVARLRLPPDTPAKEIEARINRVLDQVAMTETKSMLVKRLSGGQRKRVSIAVELIADPGIIFLDEPTSGLDPGLDRKMMFTLRQLAQAGKTVVLVTHATSNITDCDLVLFLASGGRLAFYGPPEAALDFFEVTEFAAIYDKVELEPERWITAFQESTYYQTYVEQRLRPICPHCEQPVKRSSAKFCHSCGYQLGSSATATYRRPSATPTEEGLLGPLKTVLRQTNLLLQRGLTILLRDRRNFLFLLLQAPIIGLLLFLVIQDQQLFTHCAADIARQLAQDPDYVGTPPCEFSFNQVGEVEKILFLLACIGTWLGMINAIREIVKEYPIYRRERLVNLSISAYVFSKLGLLTGLTVVQALTLVMLVNLYVPFLTWGVFLPTVVEVSLTMMAVIFTSACWGLFLSAVIGREDRVMSVIPLFLIPQIIFAGIIFSFNQTTKETTRYTPSASVEDSDIWLCPNPKLACFVSLFTFSRWGVEALGASVNLPQMWHGARWNYPTLATNKLPYPFLPTPRYLLRNWVILLAFSTLAILLTIRALRRQDVN